MEINHCLRETFTKLIMGHLLAGTSVNVLTDVELETERLVADIRGCELPDTRVLEVNIQVYRDSYQGFLLDLWEQYNEQPAVECPDLFAILDQLEHAEQ